jgi:hypothetical protein
MLEISGTVVHIFNSFSVYAFWRFDILSFLNNSPIQTSLDKKRKVHRIYLVYIHMPNINIQPFNRLISINIFAIIVEVFSNFNRSNDLNVPSDFIGEITGQFFNILQNFLDSPLLDPVLPNTQG